MHKRVLVAEMVSAAKDALAREGYEGKKTVSVKIRIHKDLRYTISSSSDGVSRTGLF